MKKIALQLALILAVVTVYGQSQPPKVQTYGLFMYSFTRFVQWPPEASEGDFEIAVLGESPIYTELKTMAERKKAGSRTIKVTKINSVAEFKKGQILYVSQDFSAKYADVAAKIGDSPVLIVTEQAAPGSKGCVNFVTNKEGRLAFELNQAAMAQHKLKASAELTRLAIAN